jgi:predicted DNA-binding transcriptional regulator AlpA
MSEHLARQLRQSLDLITPEELAVTLGVTVSTINQWREQGTGPDYTRLGRRVYYRLEDVRTWRDNNVLRPKEPTHE